MSYLNTFSYKYFKKSKFFSSKHKNYFQIYDTLFSKYRNKKITFVEIGIFSGGSLFMWRNFFGTFLSTTIKHLSKSIEFDLKIFDTLEIKFDPIIIGYFSVLVTIFNLFGFINFYNFVYYFIFSKIITLYLI